MGRLDGGGPPEGPSQTPLAADTTPPHKPGTTPAHTPPRRALAIVAPCYDTTRTRHVAPVANRTMTNHLDVSDGAARPCYRSGGKGDC